MARKGFYEELKTKKYLSTITPKMFQYVEKVFDGDNEADKKELAKALLPKIIDKSLPTKISGEDGGPIVIQVSREIANKHNVTNTLTSDNSE